MSALIRRIVLPPSGPRWPLGSLRPKMGETEGLERTTKTDDPFSFIPSKRRRRLYRVLWRRKDTYIASVSNVPRTLHLARAVCLYPITQQLPPSSLSRLVRRGLPSLVGVGDRGWDLLRTSIAWHRYMCSPSPSVFRCNFSSFSFLSSPNGDHRARRPSQLCGFDRHSTVL